MQIKIKCSYDMILWSMLKSITVFGLKITTVFCFIKTGNYGSNCISITDKVFNTLFSLYYFICAVKMELGRETFM